MHAAPTNRRSLQVCRLFFALAGAGAIAIGAASCTSVGTPENIATEEAAITGCTCVGTGCQACRVNFFLDAATDLTPYQTLIATTSELHLNDRVVTEPGSHAPGSVVNSGAVTTNVGANVLVGDVRSRAAATIRSYAIVDGLVAAPSVQLQAGAIVTGDTDPRIQPG